MTDLLKLWRFLLIYGPVRALFKAAGRMRWGRARLLTWRMLPARADIGVIGCGQFAFATIGYVLATRLGLRVRRCYDIDPVATDSYARFFSVPLRSPSADEILQDKDISLVYVVSNHASHTGYAVGALETGKSVYVEKPVSVTHEQLKSLCLAQRRSDGALYAGYNRPFSGAARVLREACRDVSGPLVVSYFISGHQIVPGHWYRNPEEGTRICGNLGHWLDLSVHMLSWHDLPDRWTVRLICSNPATRDDNMTVSLVSERGDMVTIVLVALCEPFEGINESVDLQWGEVIAKIDDFRKITIRKGASLIKRRFWPKDVGHVSAIMQPFKGERRNWREIELSTLLTLHVANMVTSGLNETVFSFSEAWANLGVDEAMAI